MLELEVVSTTTKSLIEAMKRTRATSLDAIRSAITELEAVREAIDVELAEYRRAESELSGDGPGDRPRFRASDDDFKAQGQKLWDYLKTARSDGIKDMTMSGMMQGVDALYRTTDRMMSILKVWNAANASKKIKDNGKDRNKRRYSI